MEIISKYNILEYLNYVSENSRSIHIINTAKNLYWYVNKEYDKHNFKEFNSYISIKIKNLDKKIRKYSEIEGYQSYIRSKVIDSILSD